MLLITRRSTITSHSPACIGCVLEDPQPCAQITRFGPAGLPWVAKHSGTPQSSTPAFAVDSHSEHVTRIRPSQPFPTQTDVAISGVRVKGLILQFLMADVISHVAMASSER